MLILFFKSHCQPLLPGWTTHIWVSIHSFTNRFFFPVYFSTLSTNVCFLPARKKIPHWAPVLCFPIKLNFLSGCLSFLNMRKLCKAVERIFSVALDYDWRNEKILFRWEAEEVWVYSLRELRINVTSLPFPEFPFPMPLTLSNKMSFQKPAIISLSL